MFKTKCRHIAFVVCLLLSGSVFSQENAFTAVDVSLRNSIKLNRFLINPAFSYARENAPTLNIANKRQAVKFENAPVLYYGSYLGKIANETRFGVGVFSQEIGVLNNMGGIVNFAHNLEVGEESNLTFGLNTYFYSSKIDVSKVIAEQPEPLLANQDKATIITIKPGFNYNINNFDIGFSASNLISYNLTNSESAQEDTGKGFSGYVMYTKELFSYYRILDGAQASAMIQVENTNKNTGFSGMLLVDQPDLGWVQAGFNSIYGVNAGVGFTISEKFSIGYAYNLGIGNTELYGSSHEFSLTYSFKEYEETYNHMKQAVKANKKKKSNTAVAKNTKSKTQEATPKKPVAQTKPETKKVEVKKEPTKAVVPQPEPQKPVAKQPEIKPVAKATPDKTADQKENDEQAKLAQAKTEQERKAKEQAEKLRIENEKAEQLKLAQAKAKAEQEIKAKEEVEKLRLEKEKAEQIALEKAKVQEPEITQEEKISKIENELKLSNGLIENYKIEIQNKTIQSDAQMSKLQSIVNEQEEDLKAFLAEDENTEVKFVSTSELDNKINSVKEEIKENQKELDALIVEIEKTNKERMKELNSLKIDESSKKELQTYYQKVVADLKQKKQEYITTERKANTRLIEIKAEKEEERLRRIKKAEYDNEQQRIYKDELSLENIKNNQNQSANSVADTENTSATESTNDIPIIEKLTGVQPGYYLVLGTFSNAQDRDAFIAQVIASGENNVKMFYNIYNTKYYIYTQQFNGLSEAQNAMKHREIKPYNKKMFIAKVE